MSQVTGLSKLLDHKKGNPDIGKKLKDFSRMPGLGQVVRNLLMIYRQIAKLKSPCLKRLSTSFRGDLVGSLNSFAGLHAKRRIRDKSQHLAPFICISKFQQCTFPFLQ